MFAPTTDASRTFALRYTIRGAIRVYDAGDQLEWKVVYADRAGTTAAAGATVHLPADVAVASLKSSLSRYTADQGSRPGALPSAGSGRQMDPRTVIFDFGPLRAGTGVELRVQFPHGLVTASPPAWRRYAAYPEIGVVSEADAPWEAQEQLEEERIRYIIDHVQRSEPIPVPRPPLKSLTTVLDLERVGFAKWLVETEQLNEGNRDLEGNMLPGAQAWAYQQSANWFQILKGHIDAAHVSFLHYGGIEPEEMPDGSFSQLQLRERAAHFEVIDTEGGRRAWCAATGRTRPGLLAHRAVAFSVIHDGAARRTGARQT